MWHFFENNLWNKIYTILKMIYSWIPILQNNNLLGQSIQTSMQNLESVAQKWLSYWILHLKIGNIVAVGAAVFIRTKAL